MTVRRHSATTVVETDTVTTPNPTELIHFEHPAHQGEAWCGAAVQGIYAPSRLVECHVCRELWEQTL